MIGGTKRPWVFLAASLVAVIMLVGLLVLKPGSRPAGVSENGPILVYCAAGIRTTVEAVARQYEREYGLPIQLQYGGSQTLLANIEVSKRGDLYLPADESYLKLAREKGLVAEIIPMARMTAVLAVHKGNPKNIRSLSDLNRTDVKICQANLDATAIGKATRDALQPIGQWETIARRTVVFKPTVNDVANDLKLGTVDAGFIWDAMLRFYPELEAVSLQALSNATCQIAVGILNASQQPTVALKFARYLSARDKGLKQFEVDGFITVQGDVWAEKPELVLYSGAMNRVAIEDTIRRFEEREGVQVTRIYNGCGILVAQMKAGGRPDAYLTCDKSFLPPVQELFPEPAVELSDSDIVILVPKGNPKSIHTLADLSKPGLRIGLANPEQSTLGALTQRLLQQCGILDAVMKNVVTQTPTADLLVNQMRTGALDATVVYVSNTTKVRDQLDIVKLDMPGANAVQTFSIGKDSGHRQLAKRLLEALCSAESRARYEAAGFHWHSGGNAAP